VNSGCRNIKVVSNYIDADTLEFTQDEVRVSLNGQGINFIPFRNIKAIQVIKTFPEGISHSYGAMIAFFVFSVILIAGLMLGFLKRDSFILGVIFAIVCPVLDIYYIYKIISMSKFHSLHLELFNTGMGYIGKDAQSFIAFSNKESAANAATILKSKLKVNNSETYRENQPEG
jgi:hypothetical protein